MFRVCPDRSLLRGLNRLRLVLLLCSLTVAGCGDQDGPSPPPDQLRTASFSFVVELTSDLLAPKDVDSVRVVTNWSGPPGRSVFESELGPASQPLPMQLAALYGAAGGETVDVEVTVWKGATPFTVARASAHPPAMGSAALLLSISWLCAGTASEVAPGQVASTCPAGQSCRAGACISDDRSAETLPAAANPGVQLPCFDGARCLANARVADVDRATCTIAKSTGFVPTNFAVVKPPQTTGACTSSQCMVALNPDPVEGWSDEGSAVTIPPAVCAALGDGRALNVVMSDTCPTKPAAASTCDSGATP